MGSWIGDTSKRKALLSVWQRQVVRPLRGACGRDDVSAFCVARIQGAINRRSRRGREDGRLGNWYIGNRRPNLFLAIAIHACQRVAPLPSLRFGGWSAIPIFFVNADCDVGRHENGEGNSTRMTRTPGTAPGAGKNGFARKDSNKEPRENPSHPRLSACCVRPTPFPFPIFWVLMDCDLGRYENGEGNS